MRPRFVVTLPPFGSPDWAGQAAAKGADLLEIRTDLVDPGTDLTPFARHLPLLVAERGGRIAPSSWWEVAQLRDSELGSVREGTNLVSHHAQEPVAPEHVEQLWAKQRARTIKHVEPLGDPARLFETQRRLSAKFSSVTVLATGPIALPFRAALSKQNALDYVALSDAFYAAPGQRLLADAVRAANAAPHARRFGILGSRIGTSRSPRIHPPPFERLDLPADAPIDELLPELLPHYAGFAVTSPFKRAVAKAIGSSLPALNTLVRRGNGWRGFNTDVAGAAAVLRRMRSLSITVLGSGGAADAISIAAREQNVRVTVIQRADAEQIRGAAIWTWPATVEAPPSLRFSGHPVAVIAYGPAARVIASEIQRRNGVPVRLGPAWFIAQAKQQRRLWESAL